MCVSVGVAICSIDRFFFDGIIKKHRARVERGAFLCAVVKSQVSGWDGILRMLP